MANDDKIYEAYIGNRGEESKDNTHNRIDWIMSNIKDSKEIIDIGCSQGIISLLMAREGKNVKAIDIQEEAIDFANNLLNKEFYDVRDKITFECIDFNEYKEKKIYDTVVVTEVIEHLEDTVKFIKHISEFLDNEGKVIITVPFGVCNHPDHRSTFYLSQIISLVEECFEVQDVHYIERWIGIIAIKKVNKKLYKYDFKKVAMLEEAFNKIDINMNDRIYELYNFKIEAAKKYRQSTENYKLLKDKYNECLNQYHELKEEKMETSKKYNENLKVLNTQIEENKKLIEIKEKMQKIIEQLMSDSDDEVLYLKENKALINRLQTQNNYLKQENNEYRRKLSLITDTKIGNIGIKVYKYLKKIKNKMKWWGRVC
ncbi:methyltransferase domain-containing protein [Clostridium sp. ZBS4]|uniref:class I SAM-dependent methyltransferase n=1 Tax=Clostridium sp. ZBS4 TaxID=2949974 RepID=UPI00207A2BE3|nr:methyltransferase domain-containing protein [Clostridium sp. ZBS4]